jgi:hypothetical protein
VKCKILIFAGLALAMIPAITFSEELDGEWVSELDGRTGRIAKTVYEFHVEGAVLTGTVLGGFLQEERQILKGKIKKDKISFMLEAGDGKFYYRYEGKIAGDTIKFIVRFRGRKISEFAARKSIQ